LIDFRAMPLFRNRLTAMLAVLAMVMQGFWPLLAQAQASDASLYGVICSVDGAKSVELPGSPLPADGGAGKHQKHCALCVAGGDRAQALASAPVEFVFSPVGAAAVPAVQSTAFLPLASPSPAQPRAPPFQT